jgi:photosystem II stability/assembly factor-like uncharacterized protein
MIKLLFLLSAIIVFSLIHNNNLFSGWKKLDAIEYKPTLNQVVFTSPNIGYVLCSNGLLYKTKNGGLTWTYKSFDFEGLKIQFIDDNTGWIAGNEVHDEFYYYGYICFTSDGGNTWRTTVYLSNGQIQDFYFPNKDRGWYNYISYDISHDPLAYLAPTDNENNKIYLNNGFPDKIYFANENNGFMRFGEIKPDWETFMYRTSDGGQNWTKDFDYSDGLEKFINTNLGFSAQCRYDNNDNPFSDFQKTTDIGHTWSEVSTIPGFYVKDYIILNESTGWMVGDSGKIYHTIDGGLNWLKQNSGTTNRLTSVSFIDEKHGWAVGENGEILKYEEDTDVKENSDINSVLSLFVCPNPFSASVNIKFSLPEPSQVKISLYDVFGNEVAEINDNYFQKGEYNASFSGEELNQGIYFLRLQAGKDIVTTKVVNLK